MRKFSMNYVNQTHLLIVDKMQCFVYGNNCEVKTAFWSRVVFFCPMVSNCAVVSICILDSIRFSQHFNPHNSHILKIIIEARSKSFETPNFGHAFIHFIRSCSNFEHNFAYIVILTFVELAKQLRADIWQCMQLCIFGYFLSLSLSRSKILQKKPRYQLLCLCKIIVIISMLKTRINQCMSSVFIPPFNSSAKPPPSLYEI